ncbi:hypothetical protein O97_00138, partial [Bartonella henselae str. Zeus]
QGGDRFLVTAGVPLGTPGATNLLRIASVSQDRTKVFECLYVLSF